MKLVTTCPSRVHLHLVLGGAQSNAQAEEEEEEIHYVHTASKGL